MVGGSSCQVLESRQLVISGLKPALQAAGMLLSYMSGMFKVESADESAFTSIKCTRGSKILILFNF